MTQVHWHLLITHLPIFGSIFGAFILAYGMWAKSYDTNLAAYSLFIISAIGASIAYFTGEGAEKAVENIQGVSESIIKQHENLAFYALILLIVLGVTSLFAMYLTYKNNSLAKSVSVFTLFLSLISFGLVARTGYLGGQIRHTEIGVNPVLENGNLESDDKH